MYDSIRLTLHGFFSPYALGLVADSLLLSVSIYLTYMTEDVVKRARYGLISSEEHIKKDSKTTVHQVSWVDGGFQYSLEEKFTRTRLKDGDINSEYMDPLGRPGISHPRILAGK